MAVELVVVIAVSALVVGGLIGYLIKGRDSSSREQIEKLEAELEASQTELQDYRQEVVQQFSDTAEKFKTLDESYHALHRQLATSSVALCGDAGTPLLAAASEPLITEAQVDSTDEVDEIVVSEATLESEEDQVEAREDEGAQAVQSESLEGESLDGGTSQDETSEAETKDSEVEEAVPTLTDSAEASTLDAQTEAEEEVQERKIVP